MPLRWFELKRKNGDSIKCYACGYHVGSLFTPAASEEDAKKNADGAVCRDCADLDLIYFNKSRQEFPVVLLEDSEVDDV